MQNAKELQKLMQNHNIPAYIISTWDSHSNEFVHPSERRLELLTGFTGSSGLALVTQTSGYFWTDGRYIIQANKELDTAFWAIYEMSASSKPTLSDIINEIELEQVYYDPYVYNKSFIDMLKQKLTKCKLLPFVATDYSQINLIDQLGVGKSFVPTDIEIVDKAFSGSTIKNNLAKFKSLETNFDQFVYIFSALDDICWFLNVRARDIPYCCFVISYLIIYRNMIFFFIKGSNERILSSELKKYFQTSNVSIYNYDYLVDFLTDFKKTSNVFEKFVLDCSCNYGVINMLEKLDLPYEVKKSMLPSLKAIKTVEELIQLKSGHLLDGLAVCLFLYFVKTLPSKILATYTEYTLASVLDNIRLKYICAHSLSFPTILGWKENSAMIHYSPTEKNAIHIMGEGVILIDSGAHYPCCTTDITRTIYIGNPKSDVKELYTKVLMGHIDLASCTFPENAIKGSALDMYARKYLWNIGYDYMHGTGHGVGAGIAVHESIPNISYSMSRSNTESIMEKSMIVSNEPGVYLENKFGIRIENVQVCVEKTIEAKLTKSNINYLTFEQLTLCPYEIDLINLDMLSKDQKDYLNTYHKLVYDNIRKVLHDIANKNGNLTTFFKTNYEFNYNEDDFLKWLANECRVI